MTVTTVPSTHPIAQRGPLSQTHDAQFHQSSDLQYQRREAHIPKSSNENEPLYVLTLFTDKKHHEYMTALRRQWFPPHLLKVDAHVTLFHALPGSKLAEMKQDISTIAAGAKKFPIVVDEKGIFEMNKGVGINVSTSGSCQYKAGRIRRELREKWKDFLSKQDNREKWNAHYTIMNKQDDQEEIRKCLEYLNDGHAKHDGTVEGLSLWLYDKGRWKPDEVWKFMDRPPPSAKTAN
ncbi:hypothetical protein NW768_011625 [Fusarium equiseti]|uniref:Uncharacterized protein n=1 Tax=Fusarium equiseti TaxID=61235 RepID=A0ABQ8QX29_FUSEQ|nr:hypothetical protein NW768_011625 [Fusarium equiseti]